jgi:iron complex transport system substrate-binding protein
VLWSAGATAAQRVLGTCGLTAVSPSPTVTSQPAHRVVSLLPAATEMVHALGAGSWLVGRSHECDFPADVAALPVASGPILPAMTDSRDIDQAVRSQVESGQTLYRLDAVLLKSLSPSVIVTQAQCPVCAIDADAVQAVIADWPVPPQLVTLSPQCLADVWADVATVAGALGCADSGTELIRQIEDRLSRLRQRVSQQRQRPTVVCLEWFEPLMSAGNWVPELVELAGGQPLLAASGTHSPWLEPEALFAADPEVLVLIPCGWSVEQAWAERDWLTQRPGWQQLQAVREGRVFFIDGSQYFNRPGPRLVDSAELLFELLHMADDGRSFPEIVWRRWSTAD